MQVLMLSPLDAQILEGAACELEDRGEQIFAALERVTVWRKPLRSEDIRNLREMLGHFATIANNLRDVARKISAPPDVTRLLQALARVIEADTGPQCADGRCSPDR
jgi:hypothetical protein